MIFRKVAYYDWMVGNFSIWNIWNSFHATHLHLRFEYCFTYSLTHHQVACIGAYRGARFSKNSGLLE